MRYGTTIVLFKTSREIVVAADSKSISAENRQVENLCKIVQVGKYFFVSAGLHANSELGYDFYNIAEEAAFLGTNIVESCRLFSEMVYPVLELAVRDVHKDAPEFYKTYIEGHEILNAAFFGIENNALVLFHTDAVVRAEPNRPEGFQIYRSGPINLTADGEQISVLLLGSREPIVEFLATNPAIWNMGLVAAARKLVQLEIDKEPDAVGPPIAILRLDRSGAKWIQKTPHCKSIKK